MLIEKKLSTYSYLKKNGKMANSNKNLDKREVVMVILIL